MITFVSPDRSHLLTATFCFLSLLAPLCDLRVARDSNGLDNLPLMRSITLDLLHDFAVCNPSKHSGGGWHLLISRLQPLRHLRAHGLGAPCLAHRDVVLLFQLPLHIQELCLRAHFTGALVAS